MAIPEIVYEANPTIADFHLDPAPVRGLMGPVGSGKSVGCVMEAARQIALQPNSKWVVVRNTYRELMDTTIQTWMQWLRPYGEFKYSEMCHTLRLGEASCPVLFRALDRPDDVGKLLSLEVTSAWVNEARFVPKGIIDVLQTRIGRFPRMADGGPRHACLIMDTNPPDDMHWFAELMTHNRPDGWAFYQQPGGLEPDAENLANLPPDYYQRISQGKDAAWIDCYVNGQFSFVKDGKPVYPEWNDRVHAQECEYDPNAAQFVGLDFGLTPAAAFVQRTVSGQYQVWGEIVTEDISAAEFVDPLGRELRRMSSPPEVWGDPAGENRSEADKNTPFRVLKAAGIAARAAVAPSTKPNDFTIRRSAVADHLTRMTMAGEPGLIINPKCRYLRRAMAGGYKYRQMNVTGEERFQEKPDKTIYSHVAEALQYAMIGAGEGHAVVGIDRARNRLDYSKVDQGRINHARA